MRGCGAVPEDSLCWHNELHAMAALLEQKNEQERSYSRYAAGATDLVVDGACAGIIQSLECMLHARKVRRAATLVRMRCTCEPPVRLQQNMDAGR